MIRREIIVPDPDQPRKEFNEQEMKELTTSIQSRGIKQPLTVRWNVDTNCYMVIDGGRRLEAATRLDLEELPCWIQQGERREVLIDQIVHNWQRSNLRPYETADALVRLRDEFGLTGRRLSELTGKPKGEISKLLALHDKVIPEVQKLARSADAELTKRHLYNISKLPADQQEKVAKQVASGKLTAIATEKLVDCRQRNVKPRGIQARQKRFHTPQADVVMTFRKVSISTEEIRIVLKHIHDSLA